MKIANNTWHDPGRQLQLFVESSLGLELKPFCLNRAAVGLPFLGYVVCLDTVFLSARSRKRFIRKTRQAYSNIVDGNWDQNDFLHHIESLTAFTRYAEARQFRKRVMKSYGYWSRAQIASFAAVAGTITRGTAVWPIGTTTIRQIATTTSASVLFVPQLRGIDGCLLLNRPIPRPNWKGQMQPWQVLYFSAGTLTGRFWNVFVSKFSS